MELEIKTWLKDIDRSIEEIYSFLPSEKNFIEFQNDLKSKKAIERNPKDFLAHLELGRAYQKLGLYENAIAEYKEAIRWEPIYSAAYQGLGGSYGEMRQYDKALEAYQKALNIASVRGEKGYTTNERNSIRPTLDVNGIWGGYTGEGAKTVIASTAYAKISMRLVPHQDWHEITRLFSDYFTSLAPEGTTVTVKPHHGGIPYVMPTNHPGYQAAHKAYEHTFGVAPIPQRSGGSIPIVALFEQELGCKSVLMGFGLDSDAIHSPNEHYGLFNFYRGIETIPYFFEYYAELKK